MKSNPSENGREVTGDEHYKRLSSGCPKKTRDLPNLTECQACGFRVDACAGKPRIRLLYSEWRVLLLCKRCFVRVESSKICSYCLRDASMEDRVHCCQCGRSVHSSCFQQYGTVPVCSCNSLPALDLFICVDCWVPETIARKRRISKSKRVCQHGIGLKSGDATVSSSGECANFLEDIVEGVGVHGMNVEAVKSRDLGWRETILEKNAVELAHNVLDLETSEVESCESGQDRNLNHKVTWEMDHFKTNQRVYERNKWKYGKILCKYSCSAINPKEKLIDRNETSRARWINVYTRNRWRSGKYLWIMNDRLTKGEATTIKEQESCSTRLMNVYVRKRWKNGKVGEKQSCGFQKKETELQGDEPEEGQERGSKNRKCTEKLNGDSHNSNLRLAEPVVLTDEREKVSVKLMKVYARVRLKNSGCTRKHSGDYRITEMRLEVGEGKYFHDLVDSNTCDSESDMNYVLRLCDNQGQSQVCKDKRSDGKSNSQSTTSKVLNQEAWN